MTEEEKKKAGENPVEEPTPMQELEEAHKQEMSDLQAVNKQKYADIGDILGEAEQKLGELKVQDEDAQRRSEKYRYISGIGDALSGLANLAGTAHGASNQQQTYNSNMIAQKAEQSRKERKVEMDTLSTRLDEMRARAKDIKSAGSLAEAELRSKHSRERLERRIADDKLAREKLLQDREYALKQYEAETARIKAEKDARKSGNKNPKMASFVDREGNPISIDITGIANEANERRRAVEAAIAADIKAVAEGRDPANFTKEQIEKYENWKQYDEDKAEQFIKDNLNHAAVGEHFQNILKNRVTAVTSNYP